MPSSASSQPRSDGENPVTTAADGGKREDERKTTSSTTPKTNYYHIAIQIIVHIFCLSLYLIPILQENQYGGPTLDELHIMSNDNQDIHGPNATLKQIFSNDYWGRPMQSPSSHKSWRPLTVLSFRYLKGISTNNQLTMHRIINIITHAATADVVGILATRLFPQSSVNENLLLRMTTKLVFVLHPTHVEVTANAANRNHILAVLFSTVLSDPQSPLPIFAISLISGFLASETFLFQVPAAAVTLVVCYYYYIYTRTQRPPSDTSLLSVIKDYLLCIVAVSPRLVFMLVSIGIYLGGRKYFDTLDIPEGLIRPAENPFYHFTGEHRIRNYMYVLSIHIGKSWGLDPIGFSHEYGFDCVPAIEDWNDARLALPYGLGVALLISLILAFFLFPRKLLGYVAIHWAWLLTLFPVSGFVKVGTFISDRIVVASSVSVTIWIGYTLYIWLTKWHRILPAKPLQFILIGWMIAICYLKIHNRSLQWMDSISLMESALDTCPRFAKALMETSKIYSGLYPDLLDLKKSRSFLERAREIDPDMCDLHHQFAIVAVQESKYLEYEDQLTQAVVCPFTMQGAIAQWKRYWEVALNTAPSPAEKEKIQFRYEKYSRFLQEKIEEQQREEEAKKRKELQGA